MPRVPAILTICTLLAACMSHVSDTSQATAERLGVSLRWLLYRLKEWGAE